MFFNPVSYLLTNKKVKRKVMLFVFYKKQKQMVNIKLTFKNILFIFFCNMFYLYNQFLTITALYFQKNIRDVFKNIKTREEDLINVNERKKSTNIKSTQKYFLHLINAVIYIKRFCRFKTVKQ